MISAHVVSCTKDATLVPSSSQAVTDAVPNPIPDSFFKYFMTLSEAQAAQAALETALGAFVAAQAYGVVNGPVSLATNQTQFPGASPGASSQVGCRSNAGTPQPYCVYLGSGLVFASLYYSVTFRQASTQAGDPNPLVTEAGWVDIGDIAGDPVTATGMAVAYVSGNFTLSWA